MTVGRTHQEWNDWEIAILREELELGRSVPMAQIIRNCRGRLPGRSLSSIENKMEQIRKEKRAA